jgi:hypothetical protein
MTPLRKFLKVDKDKDYNTISCCRLCTKVATTSSQKIAQNEIAIIYAQGENMVKEM